jgi:hypothetical protein
LGESDRAPRPERRDRLVAEALARWVSAKRAKAIAGTVAVSVREAERMPVK